MMLAQNIVRVFISSTFRDMHAERDHLVTVVFPELRERCRRLGLELFDVDLRWGVPDKGPDGERANSWEYCRQWIDRVQPFFICLLGQRYGTVPPPEDIRDADERTAYAGMSITEMEIVHGVLSGRLDRRSFFYFRDASVPENADSEARNTFVQQESRVTALKTLIRSRDRVCRDYACRWTGSGFADLEKFGAMVLEDLWSGILRDRRYTSKAAWVEALGDNFEFDPRYLDESRPLTADIAESVTRAAQPEPPSALDAERRQMGAFAAGRLRWFQGRAREIAELRAWVKNDSETEPRIAVLAAGRGQGKSALMARLQRELTVSDFFVVSHFVGATEQSAGARNLVERLMNELDAGEVAWERAPGTIDGEVEDVRDYPRLCQRLAARLAGHGGSPRIVLLIDAVNQLSDGHDLAWLPRRLSPQVRIVVSCAQQADLTGDEPAALVLRALEARGPTVKWLGLDALRDEDVRAIVVEYLREYCKELDAEHIDAICRTRVAHQPLYLLVLLSELRALGGNDMNRVVPALLRRLTQDYPDTVSLFDWALRSLENAYGREGLALWCGYLALGRQGMASQELADLLAKRLGPEAHATALRIERGLRPYLQARGPQLDFFHEQLRVAVRRRYPIADEAAMHGEIADYMEGRWHQPNVHALSELPWHRVRAGQLMQLRSLLCDLAFIEAKCTAQLPFDLIEDYRADFSQLAAGEREAVEIYAQFVGSQSALLRRLPHLVLQQAINQPDGSIVERAAKQTVEASGRAVLRRLHKPSEEVAAMLSINAHTTSIAACAVSPDGSLIVSSAHDQTIKVWDASTGRQLHDIPGHARPSACTFTPDGRQIVSADMGGTVRQWSATPGQHVRVLQQARSGRHCCAVSPDGGWLVTGGMDVFDEASQKWVRADNLTLIDMASGQTVPVFGDHDTTVEDCAFSADGERLAIATYSEEVVVWDFGKSLAERAPKGWRGWFHRHRPAATICARVRWEYNHPTCCALSASGTLLAVGCQGGRHRYGAVRVWRLPDARGGEPQELWKSASWTWVTACAFSPDGRLIVASSEDGTLKVWESESGVELATLEGHAEGVNDCSFTADGRAIISASSDGTIRKWHVPRQQAPRATPSVGPRHRARINALAFSADGRRLLVGSGEEAFSGAMMDMCYGELAVWDTQTWSRVLRAMEHDSIWITGCTFFGWDDSIAAAFNCQAALFDPQGGKTGEIEVGSPFLAAALAACGDLLAIAGPLQEPDCAPLRLWHGRENREVATLHGHTGAVAVCTFSSDGKWLASASADGTVRVWDVASTACEYILECDSDATACAFSSDGNTLAVTSAEHSVTLWDVSGGKRLLTLADRTGELRWPFHGCCFSPDGRLVAACLGARNVRVWDAQTGSHVAEYWSEFLMRSVAWQPGTATIAAGDDKGQLHILQLMNAVCEKPWIV